jgi:hypothetical protein
MHFTAPSKDLSVYKRKKKALLTDLKAFPKTLHFNALDKSYAARFELDDDEDAFEPEPAIPEIDASRLFETDHMILIDLSLCKYNTEDAKKVMSLFKYYCRARGSNAAFLISNKLLGELQMLDYDIEDIKHFDILTALDFNRDLTGIDAYIGNNSSRLTGFNNNGVKTITCDIMHRAEPIRGIVDKAV